MQFNSELFVFIFLPIVLYVFYKLKNTQNNNDYLVWWLIACSSVFYTWFSLKFLLMIYACTLLNYFLCSYMLERHQAKKSVTTSLLLLGVCINLLPLCYFKYTNFLLFNINTLMHTELTALDLILPLGISFFTFQNITYLIDSYYDKAPQYRLSHYILYILFFPQLIAGPIVLHSEFMPQIEKISSNKIGEDKIIFGITLFLIGLIKKIGISDCLAFWADPVFQAAAGGQSIGFIQSWLGLISFTLQLYFDFSGYTDMALGLSSMLGIVLPANFDSPFKSSNMIEFWQRWHITLSRFFQSYIFVPLAMKYHKKGYGIYFSIFFTMLISGLWHGAAWCFIIWGAFHGMLLCINHLWRKIYTKLDLSWNQSTYWRAICILLTNLSFATSLIFFRSDSVHSSLFLFKNIISIHKLFPIHHAEFLQIDFWIQIVSIACLLAITWFLPNSQTICGIKKSTTQLDGIFNDAIVWSAKKNAYALLLATMTAGLIIYQGLRVINLKTFIYFQF